MTDDKPMISSEIEITPALVICFRPRRKQPLEVHSSEQCCSEMHWAEDHCSWPESPFGWMTVVRRSRREK